MHAASNRKNIWIYGGLVLLALSCGTLGGDDPQSGAGASGASGAGETTPDSAPTAGTTGGPQPSGGEPGVAGGEPTDGSYSGSQQTGGWRGTAGGVDPGGHSPGDAGAGTAFTGGAAGADAGAGGVRTNGASGEGGEGGARGSACTPGELSVIQTNLCLQVAVCNGQGDGNELIPCEGGKVVIHPHEVKYRWLHVGETVDVSAEGFDFQYHQLVVSSQRWGVWIDQFIAEPRSFAQTGYVGKELGSDDMLIETGDQQAIVRFIVIP